MASDRKTVRLRVRRQPSPGAAGYWEEFDVPYLPKMNVLACLMEYAKNPVTSEGKKSSPVCYDSACLEEVCGSCAMRINGVSRMGCTALVDTLEQPIVIEPLAKFPVVRDLAVDRTRMFGALKRIKGWIPIDGTYDLGPGPRMPEAEREFAYSLSKCITCGNCLDVCPQINERSEFIGAAPIAQVMLFNSHPTGKMNAGERLEAIMGEGGVNDCGNAQNCVRACPKSIPLTTAIAAMYRATTSQALKNIFGK
ncbi:MAG TPA: succinate dehydrogenase iron-sulfur subunit [Thermoanaerobaculia bacterium]|nr:succinate dehydrogenase iron-sulfur subunit [Thermoanaerobaculia bacterium]